MGTILTYVAIQDGKVKRSSLEVLSHCHQLASAGGHTVSALIIDTDADNYADEVRKYGPATIYTVTDTIFGQHKNKPLVNALEVAIKAINPILVGFASTESSKDVLGALSVRLNAGVLPDVASFSLIDGGVEALRPVMAAKVMARVSTQADCVLVSVRSGSYDLAENPSEAEIENIAFDFDESSLQAMLREIIGAGGGVDLSEADVVVAGGRGVKDEEGLAMLEELAGIFNGAIGASRAVVENGLFPPTSQIGQTGKVVSPSLYFACGISGAIQHVAGMANSKVIVAINKDAEASIFDYATYGIVGDLYKVLPALIKNIKAIKGA